MPGGIPGPVLVVYRDGPMRRILCLNLEWDGITVEEATDVPACRARLRDADPAAVLIDPRLICTPGDLSSLRAALRHAGVPVIVIADGPEHRPVARLLDNAPYWTRPDDYEGLLGLLRQVLRRTPAAV